MDLGAGPMRTFFRVILPQISVSVVIAGLFAFITSFDQVETTHLHGAHRAATRCRSRCSSICRNGRTRPSRRCRRC